MTNADETGAIAAVTTIVAEAWRARTSDIHLEPRAASLRVRYRIDGLLSDRRQITGAMVNAVINRLKVLGTLDIAEKRLPQDGSFRTVVDGTEVVCRISSFPAEYGEKIVIRLLAEQRGIPSLTELGMPGALADQLRAAARRPNGLVLITGPTGSGKTSSMYALIRELERPEISIVTLEDPIEYRFPTVTQGQANPRAGFTFAAGLRAILRQDPNVIMVGEMRDAETAAIACTAALTGHMVLSSLHTNSVAETIVRLNDIGVERYVIASSLRAIVNQRLVRRLCSTCRKPAVASDADRRAMLPIVAPTNMWEARGCPRCNATGFSGRVGMFEMVEVDEGFGALIKSGAGRQDFQQEMTRRGMRSLRAAGMELAVAGITTVTEVLRVT